ncbi:unnamed protein product [Sphagnum jensenii]|uniref:SGNH hydrolase-type esterase domain-containing protein n=1 Tax=Sphagnum jensenii TaxID=128206 RepID=A0ABP0VJN9_9BRYO
MIADICNTGCGALQNGIGSAGTGSVVLYQSSPNPTSGSAVIGYSISIPFSSATIQVSDNAGKLIRQFTLPQQQGAGSVTFDGSSAVEDREYSTGLHEHIYRIAALGDSYTEGAGAPQDSSWPRLLQHELYHTDSLEVMNCGVSGSDPIFEYMLIRQKILAYHPDMIIVDLNQSDINDCIIRGGFDRFQNDGTVKYASAPWWEWIYANCFIYRRVVNGVMGYDHLLLPTGEYQARSIVAMNLIKQTVDSLSQLCSQNHCNFALVFNPMMPEIIANKYTLQPVLDYARSRGIKTVDGFQFFKKEIPNASIGKYFWKIDGHNNSHGYQMLARAVAQELNMHPQVIVGNK